MKDQKKQNEQNQELSAQKEQTRHNDSGWDGELHKKGLNMKQWAVLAVVFICLICAGVFWVCQQHRKNVAAIRSGGDIPDNESSKIITYDGKSYVYNKNLKTVLFMGVDSREEATVQEYSGTSGQSDTLLVLILNKESKTTDLLAISRNSMVELQLYSIDGEYVTTTTGQIALQYAYGDGEKKSCRLTKEAVSNLLYGIPIDAYVSLNLDGIVSLVSAFGGIEYTFTEDETEIDPEFTKGTTLLMDGAKTERYVRYRDITVTGSNEQRMKRQFKFLRSTFSQVKKKADSDSKMYDILLDSVEPYMVTDMTAEEIKVLSDYDMSDTMNVVPGKIQQGEKYDEYIVDDEELYRLILELFYVPAE